VVSGICYGPTTSGDVRRGIAVDAPFPRLKKWAYAGATIKYASAVASHMIVDGMLGYLVTPLAPLGLTIASWALRPPRTRGLSQNGGGS
jgi:hypothetical protein